LSLSQTWNFVEKSVARILKNAAACCGLTRFVGGLFLITATRLSSILLLSVLSLKYSLFVYGACMRLNISQSFRRTTASLLLLSVLTAPIAFAKAGAGAGHSAEIKALAEKNEAGTISVLPGDAMMLIAQRYATANQMPFETALNGLVRLNPSAFLDAAHNLEKGATLVIPLKADVVAAANADVDAVLPAPVVPAAANAPVLDASVGNAAPPLEAATIIDAETQTSFKERALKMRDRLVDNARVYAHDAKVFFMSHRPLSSYLVGGAGLLAALLAFLKLKGKKKKVYPQIDLKPQSHLLLGQPEGALAQDAQESPERESIQDTQDAPAPSQNGSFDPSAPLAHAEPHVMNADAAQGDDGGDELPPLADDAPINTPISDIRFNLALGGLSASSLEFNSPKHEFEPVNDPLPNVELPAAVRADLPAEVATEMPADAFVDGDLDADAQNDAQDAGVVATSTNFPAELNRGISVNFFNHNLKTPMSLLRGLTNINVLTRAEDIAQAKQAAALAAQVPEELVKSTVTETLTVDVPQFLNEFSKNIPEPSYSSVDYEDLLDVNARNQWLKQQTVADVLLYAQDAHDARYDDVAQYLLDDVLLRGTTDERTAALQMASLFSYDIGVY
jgi:hypothetical protein